MSWNTGAELFTVTPERKPCSPISMLFDHRKEQQASSLFERSRAVKSFPNMRRFTEERSFSPIDVDDHMSDHGPQSHHRSFSRSSRYYGTQTSSWLAGTAGSGDESQWTAWQS
jgi:hypothetical protein